MRIVEATVAVLVIAGIIFCIQSDSRSVAVVKDTYVMAVPSGERSSTTYLFHFNVERKTYSEEAQTADMDPIVLSSGSYTCMEKDGAGILTARADSGEEQKYLLDGKYLIGQSCFYKGMIPDTDTFEAVCTYTEDTGLTIRSCFMKTEPTTKKWEAPRIWKMRKSWRPRTAVTGGMETRSGVRRMMAAV